MGSNESPNGKFSAPGPQEEEEDELDDIDYDDLDPQILELAEQMGVHPKEIIKQLQQLQA